METQKEEWRPVVGYEGFYEVSNFGNVNSIDRFIRAKGNSKSFKKGKRLKKILVNNGYNSVHLSKLGKQKINKISSLVAEAFIGERPKNSHVMHLDGTRTNDNVNNLRYGSPSCNAAFMIDDGTVMRGTICHNSKLTEEKVIEIRNAVINKTPYDVLCKKYNVAKTTISAVVHRQNWAWV